jgi:SAM-dependent methyltransferase
MGRRGPGAPVPADRHQDVRPANARFATLPRATRLWSAFRVEQTDPDRFYQLLAADSVAQLSMFTPLHGRRLLDVGGGPGYFADAFRTAGARYTAVDADLGELSMRGNPPSGTVLGSGIALPVRTGAVDVCYSSNVLEHVADPEAMADEMVRVTVSGGTVFLSFTTWLSPWGGHETSPWHYLGGHRAAAWYRRRTGHAPKNEFGRTLFATSVRRMLRWADAAGRDGRVEVMAAFPRYHPDWAHWVVRVPGLREVAVWNLVLVLRRR